MRAASGDAMRALGLPVSHLPGPVPSPELERMLPGSTSRAERRGFASPLGAVGIVAVVILAFVAGLVLELARRA